MRKIYFIIFGVALIILILLVDWREKYYALTGKKSQPETLLGRLLPATSGEIDLPSNPEDSSLAAALAKELNETTAAAGMTETDWEQNSLPPNSLPDFHLPRSPSPGEGLGRSSAHGQSTLPPPGLRRGGNTKPRFQDVPEQLYMDESRQLMRQMMRNYDRIISPKPQNPGADRQP